MQTIIYILVAIVLIVVLFFLKKKKVSKSSFKIQFTPVYVTTGVDKELLNLINQYRSNEVTEEYNLKLAAKKHAINMLTARKASHNDALGRKKYFLDGGFKAYGELAAYGYTSAESLFKAYLKSDKHKQIIDNPIYNCIGIYTCLNDEGKMYNCIIFSKY